MNTPADSSLPLEVQQTYRDNFARHILGVTLHAQAEIMNALTLEHGHSRLRISYEPYITIAARQGVRLSDMAALLGISRQAANQTARQIEAAGYLQRAPDPSDGRARLLVTTPRGRTLIRQGSREANRVQAEFTGLAGRAAVERANRSLIALNRGLGLMFPFENDGLLTFSATLPRLSDYITDRLQTLTMQKGHPRLKRSFGTVLSFIGPDGGRIRQMARRHDVSKQAISAIAGELEDLGYIRRVPDPEDPRKVVLHFAAPGKQLIADSVSSLEELGRELSAHIGKSAFDQLREVMAHLYRSLQLEEDVFGHPTGQDIELLARQITRHLGAAGARSLAGLLLSGNQAN